MLASGQKISHDKDHIRNSYAKLDRQSRGEVSLEDWLGHYTELYRGKLGSQEEVDKAVGRITKMSKHLRAKTTIPEAVVAKLEALFKLCDKDNKGYVTIEEDRKLTEAMGFTYDETCKAHFRSPEDGSEPRVSMKEWVNYFRLAILQAMVEKACTLDQTEGIVDQMRADVEKNTPAAGAG